MKILNTSILLKKYCLFSLFNTLFLSAIPNMFSKNLFKVLYNPLYHIHRVKNIEYLYFICSFTIVLFLQCEKYIKNISQKIYFLSSFASKMIFYSTFKIVLYFGFGFSLNYYRNFALLATISGVSSILDTIDYKFGRKSIKNYKPEGFIVLIFKYCFEFFKESHRKMFFPFVISLYIYNISRFYFYLFIFNKRISSYNEFLHTLSSFFTAYISTLFYNFICCATIFSYDYNISNIGNSVFNDVNFDELPVHKIYFNKLISCFEEKETRFKILKTRAVVDYIKRCVLSEIKNIKEILEKFKSLDEENEHVIFYFVPHESTSLEFPTKKLLRKVPKNNYLVMFFQKLKSNIIKRFYKIILTNCFITLRDMNDFLKEAEEKDYVFDYFKEINHKLRRNFEEIEKECNVLEKNLKITFDVKKYIN
ncbi:hypothetical protein TUBRATIS_15970 [Tubulinosema ratisbonensis]|uniref:Uncharacterized protein n=1 Tax=Tubulinosema ratisbonensis TaxID=291195 RepID=A0A437ALG8_9MICR|nr:hypothetical protein TUBRATIS_15970 [Tubulinosema ratisbonensis]